MFGKNNTPKRKKSGPPAIVRFFISLIIFAILCAGLYQAFKSFAGFDPLTLNIKTLPKNILASDSAYKIINSLLTFSPGQLKDVVNSSPPSASASNTPQPSGNIKFKFAVMADSHIDMNNLSNALSQAKQAGAVFIIGMGDLSDVGTIQELQNSKQQYDLSGLPYYITPGDHDLWDARNKKLDPVSNFVQVFGTPYKSFSYQDVRFLLIYNSDDYLGLSDLQMNWVKTELERSQTQNPKLLFIVADTPLYHPTSDHVMNKLNDSLKSQASTLMQLFSQYKVNEVFSADTHFFSRYTEPTTGLKMTTVGAVTSDRNPQSPRFAMVDVYDNGSYNVEETEVK